MNNADPKGESKNRGNEIVAILANAILRLHVRAALGKSAEENNEPKTPTELPANCLEVCDGIVLSVDGVNGTRVPERR